MWGPNPWLLEEQPGLEFPPERGPCVPGAGFAAWRSPGPSCCCFPGGPLSAAAQCEGVWGVPALSGGFRRLFAVNP